MHACSCVQWTALTTPASDTCSNYSAGNNKLMMMSSTAATQATCPRVHTLGADLHRNGSGSQLSAAARFLSAAALGFGPPCFLSGLSLPVGATSPVAACCRRCMTSSSATSSVPLAGAAATPGGLKGALGFTAGTAAGAAMYATSATSRDQVMPSMQACTIAMCPGCCVIAGCAVLCCAGRCAMLEWDVW
jgi:hypothetical protein